MSKLKKLFGTDGIRGKVNHEPITPNQILQLGMGAGNYFKRHAGEQNLAVIGKDTRLSGYMIESALIAGFSAVGINVRLLGPIPTPAVAQFTRSLRADVGVMITASHNPYYDNGIKFFGPDGFKLSDDAEAEIESFAQNPDEIKRAAPGALGRAMRINESQARYIEIAKATFPKELSLAGLRIVVDCANGAAYRVAPEALWELGADVIAMHNQPDGFNINAECGATDVASLSKRVLSEKADIGLAFDGDADRLIIVDECGETIDGDQILGFIASNMHRENRLTSNVIVSTVMANMMFEKYLEKDGLDLVRTAVGDRYVVEQMRKIGSNLGGEQSGHIILSDFATTGDGLIAALQALAYIKKSGKPASEACRVFEPFPQVTKSIHVDDHRSVLDTDSVKAAIAEGEAIIGSEGRLLVRPSGTEPVIRVMAEGDPERSAQAIEVIFNALKSAN